MHFAKLQCSSCKKKKNAARSTFDCTGTHCSGVNFAIEIHVTYCPCIFDAEKKKLLCCMCSPSPHLYLPESDLDPALYTRAAAFTALSLLTGQIDRSRNHWLPLLSMKFCDEGVGPSHTVCVNRHRQGSSGESLHMDECPPWKQPSVGALIEEEDPGAVLCKIIAQSG